MTAHFRFFILLLTLLFAATACSSETNSGQSSNPQSLEDVGPDLTDIHPDTPDPDQKDCGSITLRGECFGNTAFWCEDNELHHLECNNSTGSSCHDGVCTGIQRDFPCDETSRNTCAHGLLCQTGRCTAEDSGDLRLEIIGHGRVTSASQEVDCSTGCVIRKPGNTKISLTAQPDIGWKFTGWTNDCTSSETTTHLTFASRAILRCTATFERVSPTVMITSQNTRVVSEPAGIDCGSECIAAFEDGKNITLTAIAEPGFIFIGWSGCINSKDASITINATFSHRCTATSHKIADFTLEIVGPGHVTNHTTGIDCNETCTTSIAQEYHYELMAEPGPDARFLRWEQDCTGTNTNLSLYHSSNDPLHCRAIFETLPSNPLTVSIYGDGTITSDSGEINCPQSACTASFLENKSVTLTANPSPKSRFVRWTDPEFSSFSNCNSYAQPFTLSMQYPQHCQAVFVPIIEPELTWHHAAVPGYPNGVEWNINGTQITFYNDQIIRHFDRDSSEFIAPEVVSSNYKSQRLLTWNPQKTKIISVLTTTLNDDSLKFEILIRDSTVGTGTRIVSPVPVTALAWRPIGGISGRFASAGEDGSIRIWESRTLHREWSAHDAPISALAWSPDANYLASTSASGKTRIWSTTVVTMEHELTGPAWNSLSWNHDSTKIAGATHDQIHVWSPDETNKISWPANNCESVTFNPSSTKLLATCDSKLTVWDVTTRSRLFTYSPSETTLLKAAQWSPTQDEILALYDDHSARIVHGDTGELLKTLHHGAGGELTGLIASPTNNKLYAASADGFVYAVDTETGAHIESLYVSPNAASIQSIALTPSADKIIAAQDSYIYEWSTLTGVSVLPPWNVGAELAKISLSDNDVLATSLTDTNDINIWPTRGQPHTKTLVNTEPAPHIAWQPGGNLLASTSKNETHLWNTETGLLTRTLHCPGDSNVIHVSFSTDGRHIAIACTWQISFWNATNGDHHTTLPGISSRHIAWQPGTNTVAFVVPSHHGKLHIFDPVSDTLLIQQTLDYLENATQVAWSTNGQQLFIGSDTGVITAFDINH